MRTRHWLKSLFSGLLLASSATVAYAQDGYVADPNQVFGPANGYAPYIDPASPQAAGYAVPYTGLEQAGYPPGGMSAWPQISPYAGPAVDQHANQGGLWFNEQLRGPGRYYATIGGGMTRYGAASEAVVGDPRAPGYFVSGGQANNQNAGIGLINLYRQHSWRETGDRLTGGAFQGVFGWDGPDGRGVFFNGFYSSEGNASYNQNPNVPDPLRPEDTLVAGAGVSIFDGGNPTIIPATSGQINPITVPGGGTQGYDMVYSLQWQSQAYGAGVGFYADYLIRRDTFQLRPALGLRVLNVRENALFQGQDSGLSYTIVVPGGAGNNTAGGQRVFTPSTGSVAGIPDILTSRVNANVKELLAGPEIGLRYDLGGNKFKIYGSSKFGLLANHSTRELSGFGIGRSELFQTNSNGVGRVLLPANLLPIQLPSDAQDPDHSQTAFHDQSTSTSASPTFEQSLNLKAPLLGYVPIIRNVPLFEQAQFNFGYTLLLVGAHHRPGDVIDWQGYPNVPRLNDRKGLFQMSTWTVGVEWDY